MKITGHASSTSIKPYLQLNDEHHSSLVTNLREKTINVETREQPTSTSHLQAVSRKSASLSVVSDSMRNNIFTNCTFNNCSF